MKARTSIAAIFVAVLFVVLCYARAALADDAENYLLSERCGHAAQEWFIRSWKNSAPRKDDDGATLIPSYRNHYSRRMNACIVLEDITRGAPGGDLQAINRVLDLNEQRELATFWGRPDKPDLCRVLGRQCSSLKEWNSLVEELMSN